jgi:hypothetical protein
MMKNLVSLNFLFVTKKLFFLKIYFFTILLIKPEQKRMEGTKTEIIS